MERLLKVTNTLLAIIAVCLVLLVAHLYRIDVETTAYAQPGKPQPVYLVYSNDVNRVTPVVGQDGRVPTKQGR